MAVKKEMNKKEVTGKVTSKKPVPKSSSVKSAKNVDEGKSLKKGTNDVLVQSIDKINKVSRNEPSMKLDDDHSMHHEDNSMSFDLDDDIAPVEDDGGDDDIALEVRKKEISRAGYEKLIVELKDLEENQIPGVNNRIKEAREFGDLSENAEYQSAIGEKQMLDTRISELKETIAISIIVDTNKSSDSVQYGSIVTFIFLDTNELETVTIIGSAEISFEKKATQVSFDSPIGLALEGKKVGDTCKVRAEKGRFDIKIVSIK